MSVAQRDTVSSVRGGDLTGLALRVIAMALTSRACFSASASELSFEIASIRPAPSTIDSSHGPVVVGPKGAPGTEDPGRYSCNYCDVSELVSQAYDVPEYRIFSGNRLPEDRFHIAATMPAETTREQFRVMLQNLLADRFKLRVHHESREMQMFRLLVSSGGSKLKAHVEGASSTAEGQNEMRKRAPGFYYKVQAKSTADFTRVVEGQLHKPVTDATGLDGKYDFDIWWTADYMDAEPLVAPDSPTIYSAIRSLGLKLEPHKGQVDVLAVDHVEKMPTEN
jgi:uncharacterized protein (TIGR03435 family)